MSFTAIPWQDSLSFPLLVLIQLNPIVWAIVIYLLRGKAVFTLSWLAALIELFLVFLVFQLFDRSIPVMQFSEEFTLYGALQYHVAVDGISIMFLLLTGLITLLVIAYAPIRKLQAYEILLPVILGIEATSMSLFLTVDLLWFVLCSGLQLVLIGYILWRWATSYHHKDLMFTRFMQFMSTGLALLLIGTVVLGWHYADVSGGDWTFNLFELSQLDVAENMHSVIFFFLFYGLAVRIPLFPLHGWLPLAAEHGNVAVAPIFLLGLKTGVYGLIRFVIPIVPEAVSQWNYYVAAFAMTGIFYAALLALVQDNIRRLLAFAVVSHTSFLVIGLFTLDHLAFQGAILLSINFGLAVSALLLMSGIVYARTGTMQLGKLGGLFDHIPIIGVTFLIAGLSIVGMPGTPGFDAVHLLMEAAIDKFGALLTIAAALGNVTAAGFLLWAFQRAFLTPATREELKDIPRVTPPELMISLTLIAVILASGFYATPWLELVETSVQPLSALFEAPVPGELN